MDASLDFTTESKVLSQIQSAEVIRPNYNFTYFLNNQRQENVLRTLSKESALSRLQAISYNKRNNDEVIYERIIEIGVNYQNTCKLLERFDISYVIIDAQYNHEFEYGVGYCGILTLETENYRVFEMRYDN
jgi:hypothetical protein